MAKFYLDRYFAKAEQVRFETPVYDHYEDEYGDEQRECVREGTSKRSLCKRVQETNAPIYYFRRWNSRATDDKHYINHTYKDSCDVIAKTWGRRVLIMPRKMHRQLTDEAKKSFDKASKIKYNSPLDKMTKKKSNFEQLLSHYFDLNTAIIESNSSC